jgi:hypothetical protein
MRCAHRRCRRDDAALTLPAPLCPKHRYALEAGQQRATEKHEQELRQWMHDDAMAGIYAQRQEDEDRRQAEIDEDREMAERERAANDRVSERGERFPWDWP